MAKNRTHEKLEKLYADKKARNFINHLIRSYVPMNKVKPLAVKREVKCVLSNQPLISVVELCEIIGEDTPEGKEFLSNVPNIMKEGDDRYTVDESLLGRKSLGVQAQGTDTNMSYEAYQAFYDWVVTKMLMGDKHINWVLGKVNKNKFYERADGIDNEELQEKLKKSSPKSNKATYTIGDLGVLQALKKKMEGK
jgi:hypothetical protein